MKEIDQTTFEAEVQEAGEDLSPACAGLLFAREIAYPRLRPSDYLIRLDELAAAARSFLAHHARPAARGLALADFLFHSGDFRGDYGAGGREMGGYETGGRETGGRETRPYDPRNAYLNEVLDRRRGLPISLSVIYLEVGRRLGLPVEGVGLPGHFIVSVEGEDGPIYLDPFHSGNRLAEDDCARLVRSTSGYEGAFDRRWLWPTGPRDIVARMLNNLRNFYVLVEDWPLAVKVVERLRELQPHAAAHLRDLGLLHYRAGALRTATQFLEAYLAQQPDASDFDTVRQSRDLLLEHLARLN